MAHHTPVQVTWVSVQPFSLSRPVCLLISQSTVVGLAGLIGLPVLVRASMISSVISLRPSDSDFVPVLTPPLPKECHLVIFALEKQSSSSAAASFQTVQWLEAGGRGLHPGLAPPPVERVFSCQPGCVTIPLLDLADDTVMGQMLRDTSAASVPVQWTGSGPVGPIGARVRLPASHKAEFPP